jgi:hypothetical protein
MIFLISVVICYNFKLLLMIFVGVSKKTEKKKTEKIKL